MTINVFEIFHWKGTIKSGIMNQPSARQFLWVREEQSFCLACISAYLWSVKRDPKQRLDSASENVATETGPRVWRQALLFTCLYNSINTVGMPGKSKSSRTLRVHECVHDFFFLLHVQNCVLVNVCADTKSPSAIPKIFFFPPLLLITIDLGVAVYFLFLSLVCHHLHMVVFCIHSFLVCDPSSFIAGKINAERLFSGCFLSLPPIQSWSFIPHAWAAWAVVSCCFEFCQIQLCEAQWCSGSHCLALWAWMDACPSVLALRQTGLECEINKFRRNNQIWI